MVSNYKLKPLSTKHGFLFFLIFSFLILLAPLQISRAAEKLSISKPEVIILTNGDAVVSWQTNIKSSGLVMYGPSGFDLTATHQGNYTDHSVVLKNLDYNKLYHYKIISETEDDYVASAHLLFWSHQNKDLQISNLSLKEDFLQYQGFVPALSSDNINFEVVNNGDIDIKETIYLSAILAETDKPIEAATLLSNKYSCFKEVKVEGGLKAKEVRQVNIDRQTFSDCPILEKEYYQLTVALDYSNEVGEANEFNNVGNLKFQVLPQTEEDSFQNIQVNDVSPYAATIKFNLEGDQTILLEYDQSQHFNDHNFYLFSRAAVKNIEGNYEATIKGLNAETEYSFRLVNLKTNAVSENLTFTTIKDPNADVLNLISLKRNNPACRVVQSERLNNRYWQELGLEIPDHYIVQYRIKWFVGGWSPWYIPGSGDVDWKTNADGTVRRVWSYFGDHTFEYVTCQPETEQLLVDPAEEIRIKVDAEPQVLGFETETVYGQVIDRDKEYTDSKLVELKDNIRKGLWQYKTDLTDEEWQTLNDAYLYGGYNYQELKDFIHNGSGALNPEIPASEWRQKWLTQIF